MPESDGAGNRDPTQTTHGFASGRAAHIAFALRAPAGHSRAERFAMEKTQ